MLNLLNTLYTIGEVLFVIILIGGPLFVWYNENVTKKGR